jgi:hypothetical protein
MKPPKMLIEKAFERSCQSTQEELYQKGLLIKEHPTKKNDFLGCFCDLIFAFFASLP